MLEKLSQKGTDLGMADVVPMAAEVEAKYSLRDITHATVSEDFKRNPKLHMCWEIRHPAEPQ